MSGIDWVRVTDTFDEGSTGYYVAEELNRVLSHDNYREVGISTETVVSAIKVRVAMLELMEIFKEPLITEGVVNIRTRRPKLVTRVPCDIIVRNIDNYLTLHRLMAPYTDANFYSAMGYSPKILDSRAGLLFYVAYKTVRGKVDPNNGALRLFIPPPKGNANDIFKFRAEDFAKSRRTPQRKYTHS